MTREEIFELIQKERIRQDRLHPYFPNSRRPSILGEECGEVHKAWLEHDTENLKEELVHTASVAIRWLETFND